VAVLRALPGLGDLLCAVPALRSLRAAQPHAEVTLIGVPEARWFAPRYPELVEELLELPWWPGIPEAGGSPDDLPAFLAAARARHFDAAIQLHGSGNATNALVAELGATVTAGHHEPYGPVINARTYRPWPTQGHEIDRLLDLVVWLGGRRVEPVPYLRELPTDLQESAALRHAIGDRPYACLHPGASRPDRRWAWQGFAHVASALAGSGLTIVVTGTAAEQRLAARVTGAAEGRGIVAAGTTTLGALASIVRRAAVVVANDTGVAHLAVAVDRPVVVVVTTSDEARWAPRDRVRNRVVVAVSRRAGRCDPSPDVVAAAALELLATPQAQPVPPAGGRGQATQG
jgi:ADP-heptose:LPS heptosyltransferase